MAVHFILAVLVLLASSQQAPSPPRSLEKIASRSEFDAFSRVYYQGRFYALPHLMFVIDRANHGTVYYVDSKRYAFHTEFVNANYLTLERGQEFFTHNYVEANRRFLLGTIAYHERSEKFSFEFWEGDQLTPALLSEAYARIGATFYAKVYFKYNSERQRAAALQAKEIPVLPESESDSPGDYLPLNLAHTVGVLRIIDRVTPETIIDRNEIVIFHEPPISLTPLSGVITTTFSTPLSHVNLLCRGWGIPNAYLKNADQLFKPMVGKFVYFETGEDGFTLRPAELKETAEYGKRLAQRSDLLTPEADLKFEQLTELKDQRRGDALRFGAKAANLGEVVNGLRGGAVRNIEVPAGFSIPFHFYEQFLIENHLDDSITVMLGNDRFNHDAVYRRKRLADLRASIQHGRLSPAFAHAVTVKTRTMFGDRGVFVRSSTNSEDLPNFSGAGLYTTVPNVHGDAALAEAIKTVWASLWNYEAYEARESAGINHAAVYPAVLVQEGMNADAAGVLITTNPFDREEQGTVYINAKRGLGIRVVEGRSVPEQLIYYPSISGISGISGGSGTPGSVRVLTRSDDDTMLKFDERGGVREIRVEKNRAVLTDGLVARLATAAIEIKQVFGGRDQDIEWLVIGEKNLHCPIPTLCRLIAECAAGCPACGRLSGVLIQTTPDTPFCRRLDSLRHIALLVFVAVLSGCGRRDNGTRSRPALDHCLPQSASDADWPSLAINGVKREPDGTSVKLVAYALDQPARFVLPLYVMSAGRWLINNSDRTYLLDEACQEYKLKDKKVPGGQKKVEEGKVLLKPGEAFEVTLVFTPLSSDARAGALVYGGQTMRFAVSP